MRAVSPVPRRLAIFDLDFTFINANSTYEFIGYYLSRSSLSLGRRMLVFAFHLVSAFGVPLQRLIGKRRWFISLLTGADRGALRRIAADYVKERAVPLINDDIRREFDRLRQGGCHTVLLSSSLDAVVEQFALQLGFHAWHASALAYGSDGRCLGYLERDLTGNKHELLADIEAVTGAADRAGSSFFTDNLEDVPLVKEVGNGVGVVSDALKKKFWTESGVRVLGIIPALRIDPKWLLVPTGYYFYFRTSFSNFLFYQLGALVTALLVFTTDAGPAQVALLLAALLGYLCIYEIGYFSNDFAATRGELNPSLRISASLLKRLAPGFVAARVICFAFVIVVLSWYLSSQLLFRYVAGVFATLLVFFIHNALAQKRRMVTYAILKLSHFVIPLAVFDINLAWPALAVSLFYLPIPLIRYAHKIYAGNARTVSIQTVVAGVAMAVGAGAVGFLAYNNSVYSPFLKCVAYLFVVDLLQYQKHLRQIFKPLHDALRLNRG